MLHGDFKQPLREKVFRKFKSGYASCLIATNVAARGLDFPQIDLIIQMQPPTTTDSYIHRSGRTGRAGKAGICATLYCGRS
jgi:ATP-dependent RNA helicase DDX21